jgi:Leucine-rich repeat (LRR) protein
LGVGLGAARPSDLGPADGEAECRIAGGTRITDLGLSKLANLKKLRRLDLSGAAVTSAGLKTLAQLPDLRRLNLWNVKGIDASAAAHLEVLTKLAILDLSDTAIGDDMLARLGKLPALKRLYMNDTNVTAAGVAAFQKQHPAIVVASGARPPRRIPLSPLGKP